MKSRLHQLSKWWMCWIVQDRPTFSIFASTSIIFLVCSVVCVCVCVYDDPTGAPAHFSTWSIEHLQTRLNYTSLFIHRMRFLHFVFLFHFSENAHCLFIKQRWPPKFLIAFAEQSKKASQFRLLKSMPFDCDWFWCGSRATSDRCFNFTMIYVVAIQSGFHFASFRFRFIQIWRYFNFKFTRNPIVFIDPVELK